MKLFKKVAIIGVGLIGGSIALAIKKRMLAGKVVGTSRHAKNLLLAKRLGAIDEGSQDIEVARGADLVVLALPINAILKLAPAISKIAGRDCIVIDVGSTKEKIVNKLERIFPRYVGTHPMAGSEKRGIASSNAKIFQGSICIVTPTKNTDRAALLKVRRLWSCLGVRVVTMPCDSHDKILAFVSHLPHIAAFSLINTVPQQYLQFAASSLRDTTRIAASDSEIWSDIFFSNRNNILAAIGSIQKNLAAIKKAIASGDSRSLNNFLKTAKKKRDSL